MRHKLILFNLLLIVVFIFSFTACTTPKTATETTAAQTTIPETVTIITTTTIVETTATETTAIDMDKVKFWEAVVEGEKSYDISDKVLDYPMEEINILSDVVDGKIGTDEEILRFWELANKVQKDFFLSELIIKGSLKEKGITPNDEMIDIINMITEWADKIGNSYSYYAKYLDTEQAEYDFKVDECKEEADKIHQEYLVLRHPFIEEYNAYNGIK